MELVTPSIGLVFWTTVSFLLLIFILSKFAWKPVMQALREREDSIENALLAAEKAKEEIANLNAESEILIKKAKDERDAILKDAKSIKDGLISDAKKEAEVQANKMIAKAKAEIETQKNAALAEVKNQVASLSIEIAEKVLSKQLEDKSKQETLVADLLKDVKLN
jgi:F-type H+-transporting ATPase subunit b